MSQIHVTARLVIGSLVALASGATAQPPGGERGTQGRIREQNDERASTTIRTEQELKLSIEVPALPSAQCEAVVSTSYHQRNTAARVESTIETADCGAAAGEFKIAIRVRDESGEVKTLEFDETWQRSDEADVTITADYPIGENVELISARVRGLTCTCAEPRDAAGQ